jgi:hypothetical protein
MQQPHWSLHLTLCSALTWLTAGAPAQAAPNPICTTSSIAFDANPVTAGTPVVITGTIKQATSGTGCSPGTPGTPVTAGRLTIEERRVVGGTVDVGVSCSTVGLCTAGAVGVPCSTNAVCDSSVGAGDGVCTLADFYEIDHDTPNVNGQVSTDPAFDTSGLGGSTLGFRAHYAPTGGAGFKEAKSPCADLIIDQQACARPLSIAATFAQGDGTPAPGDSGPWMFEIAVTACEDVTGVFAQGGTNGWAPMTGYSASTGSVAVRNNNKNEVLRWTIGNMTAPQEETLDVTVNGAIKKGTAECGKIKYLSGPWSATYSTDGGTTFQKSDYTGRVSLIVTCP